MKIRSGVVWLYLTIALCCSNIDCMRVDSSEGSSAPVDEHPNACSLVNLAEPIFGPKEFKRSKGKPITEYSSFNVPTNGELCVLISNGLHDPPLGNRLSSAWIKIDDKVVIDPSSFSQVVERISKSVPVAAGDHELSVKLASKPDSFISVELRYLPEDTEPPVIVLDKPEIIIYPESKNTLFTFRDIREGDVIDIKGKAYDATGIADIEIRHNDLPLDDTLYPGGIFSAKGILETTGQGPFVDNTFVIKATDYFGLTTSITLVVSVQISNILPGRILVRFVPNASSSDINELISSIGGTILSRYLRTKQYYIGIDPSTDTMSLANRLSQEEVVYYALPSFVFKLTGLCDPSPESNDPLLDTPGQYYLGNDPNFIAFSPTAYTDGEMHKVGIPCEPGVPDDCSNIQEACFAGVCTLGSEVPEILSAFANITCSTDVDCEASIGLDSKCVRGKYCRNSDGELTATLCTNDNDCIAADLLSCRSIGLCGKQGAEGFDIGWIDSQAEICDIEAAEPENEVVIAVVEFQYADILHPDLQARIWTNFLECRGEHCLYDDECVNLLGLGSRCVRGKHGSACDGPDPDVLPDCVFGDATPGDGCPGLCGDDDGDGFADEKDPEVQDLKWRLLHNSKDDDYDGAIDEADEEDLALWDDDEDGYIDDIHGFDFGRAYKYGELSGSTHPDALSYSQYPLTDKEQYGKFHATMVSGVIGAEMDNGINIAGIDPSVRIIPIGITTDWSFPELENNYVPAMHYAADHGARIVNMSWTGPIRCLGQGGVCAGIPAEWYIRSIEGARRLFRDGLSPSLLYVIAAGNDRDDITVAPIPINGACNSIFGYCYWSFPQNIGTYPDLSGTGTPYNLVIAATNIRDELVDYFAGRKNIGSNVGSILAEGGCAVDFAAPSDTVDGLTYDGGVIRTAGGTSFAAPVVSGIAGVLASWMPELYDGRPSKIIEQLSQTIEPCTSPLNSSLRNCEGNMLHEGRVDLYNALNSSLPDYKQFENESWRLNDNLMRNTKDVVFFDSNLNDEYRGVTHMVEVFFSPPGEERKPSLYYYYPLENKWLEIDGGRIPDIPGNYSKIAAADFNNDGCTDLVIAGSSQVIAGHVEPVRNRLLFQNGSSGNCYGTWRDVGDEGVINGFTRLPKYPWAEITMDVDIFDFNGDGLPDILFTNNEFHKFPYIGGDVPYPVQLLINRNDPQTIGSFYDNSPRFPDYTANLPGTSHKLPRSSTICDVDQDGDLDVVQAVWEPINVGLVGRNRLFIYDSSTGFFTEEGLDRGFPEHSGITNDVVCYDISGPPQGEGPPDGYPEIIFAQMGWRLEDLRNTYLANNGDGTFTDRSDLIPIRSDITDEYTTGITVCKLDIGSEPMEFFANGQSFGLLYSPTINRMLQRMFEAGPLHGNLIDKADEYGFDFDSLPGVTEDIECVDLDGDERVDAVFVGEFGGRNLYYVRQ